MPVPVFRPDGLRVLVTFSLTSGARPDATKERPQEPDATNGLRTDFLTLTPHRGPGQAPASPLISPRVVVGWELLHGARERDVLLLFVTNYPLLFFHACKPIVYKLNIP